METSIVLWIKWAGMVEIKPKDFEDAFPIMPLLWIMAWRSMENGEPRLPWVHPIWQVLRQGSRIDRVHTDIKTAKNSNHIMASFTNHYNAISIDRLPSKTEIGKAS